MQITDALTQLNLDAHLEDFEILLRESVAVDDNFLSEVSRHLMDAGGKRIRPVLAITAAAAGGAEIDRNVLLSGIAV
ncbi:MAG: polyprenyl synthetase family protein, partial [Actinomycetota bacterium]|nr:polyprenyl synthetase family protein [Actinomycetota bacterium]